MRLTPERLLEKDILSREQGLSRPKAISATRSLEDVDRLPFTVWVVSAEDILRNGFVTLGDVLRAAPGIRVSQPGNALEGETFLMRGLSGNQYVKILINDVPVKPSAAAGMPIGSQLPIRQAERIEVYYGPASAIYGNEACAGVVNIILKETERPIFTQADLSFGRYGYNSLDLMCGGKLGKDKKIFRFSLYGSSTVRERTDIYDDNQNLYNLQNYLPFGLDSTVYANNPNYRANLGEGSYPKTAPVAHESRLFGINLTWRGIHFTYHRMGRTDFSALGLNPLAVSWTNPSDRVVELSETFALGFQRQRKRYVSNTTISFLTYRIRNTSTTTYIFDRLSAATFYTRQQATNAPPDSVILGRVYRQFAQGSRYTVASGLDARFESRINAKVADNLYLDVGLQANLGGGLPPAGYLEVPVEIGLIGETLGNRSALKPYDPWSDGDLETSVFSQIEWRSKRLTLVGGGSANVSVFRRFDPLIMPRGAALYRIDSNWTVRANYSEGFRRPSVYQAAQSFAILPNRIDPAFEDPQLTETIRSYEIGFRFHTKSNYRADVHFFQEKAYNLIRDGYLAKNTDLENGDSVWNYGMRNMPGLALSMYGFQGLFSSENYNINPKEKRNKYKLSTRTEFFVLYARGKEWLGEGLAPTTDVRNAPRWHTQFRTFFTLGKLELMFASNRQTSVLSKSAAYPALYQRGVTQTRYPTFRSWDMMMRFYLSNHFLLYFQLQNMYNRHYAGLDATGTPDDLLYNPQQGRIWRFGVNYNMN